MASRYFVLRVPIELGKELRRVAAAKEAHIMPRPWKLHEIVTELMEDYVKSAWVDIDLWILRGNKHGE